MLGGNDFCNYLLVGSRFWSIFVSHLIVKLMEVSARCIGRVCKEFWRFDGD